MWLGAYYCHSFGLAHSTGRRQGPLTDKPRARNIWSMSPPATEPLAEALADARRAWRRAQVRRKGGRAALAAALIAPTVALFLWFAGLGSLPWLAACVALGLAAAAVAIGLVWRTAAAREWVWDVDQVLNLRDALPAYLEHKGTFRPALQGVLAPLLSPGRLRRAMPAPRPWPLLAALLLCALPLALLLAPGRRDIAPTDVAQAPEEEVQPHRNAPSVFGNGDAFSRGEQDEVSASTAGVSGDGDGEVPPEGELAPAPSAQGEERNEMQQLQTQPEPVRQPQSEAGNAPQATPTVPEPEELPFDVNRIRPDVGKGDTESRDVSRWVYDPDGTPVEDATPRPPRLHHPGESAVSRGVLTSRERKLIGELFRRLYE
jgi:hypothetical protein